jgi:hypothetical protein
MHLNGELMVQLNKANSYAPTEAMRNNARRGLALREKWNRGGLDASQAKSEGVGSGVARARDIINGSLSLDTVKRMYAFFSRHEKNYAPKKKMPDGGPTAGTIAWLLWGGSSGLAWARSILREQQILKSYIKEITEDELNSEDSLLGVKMPITKATDEELKQATFIVMAPDEVDLHGDITTEQEVRKACHNFNKYSMKANLFHLVETNTFEFCESYVCPSDFVLGDKFVKKGTWVATVQCLDDSLWELIKSGEINGLSIGALAAVETIEEED